MAKKPRRLRDPLSVRPVQGAYGEQLELGEGTTRTNYAAAASPDAHQAFIDRIKRIGPGLADAGDDGYDWLR